MDEEKILTPIIFAHEEFGEIRTFWIDGRLYFIGKEVATKLGYKDTDQAIRDHVKDKHKLIYPIYCSSSQNDGAGQRRNMTLISETGLYTLILQSHLPAAEKFQDWVTEEVLPSLRKNASDTMFSSDNGESIFWNQILFAHEEFGEIRTFKKGGLILFAAADVCAKLDIQNTSQAVEDFDEDEKSTVSIRYISSNGVIQTRNILAVTEPGLYRLIIKSRKPEAKKFQHWVFHEVLPSLRQTGSYTMPGSDNGEKIVNIYFGGGSNMSEESSKMWVKEKSGENLVRLAKLLGSKDLTSAQEYVLQKAFFYLTGEHFPVQKEKQQE